ncbi:MAG: hypothetical protein ABI634_01560 [Acidobacteriota bacterium]
MIACTDHHNGGKRPPGREQGSRASQLLAWLTLGSTGYRAATSSQGNLQATVVCVGLRDVAGRERAGTSVICGKLRSSLEKAAIARLAAPLIEFDINGRHSPYGVG